MHPWFDKLATYKRSNMLAQRLILDDREDDLL
jgi:hypothetical protein